MIPVIHWFDPDNDGAACLPPGTRPAPVCTTQAMASLITCPLCQRLLHAPKPSPTVPHCPMCGSTELVPAPAAVVDRFSHQCQACSLYVNPAGIQ